MRPLDYAEIVADQATLRDAIMQAPDGLFARMPLSEIPDYKAELIAELVLDAAFKLLTKIEADIRQDFIDTYRNGWSDSLSLHYAQLLQSKQQSNPNPAKIGVGTILAELRRHFRVLGDPFQGECIELQSYLAFRHWYAHGRFLQRMPAIPIPVRIEAIGYNLHSKVIVRIH
jgi:hypothetical protein